MKNRLRLFAIAFAAGTLAACASSSTDVGPTIALKLASRPIAVRIGSTTPVPIELLDPISEDDVEVFFEGLPAGIFGRSLHLSKFATLGELDLSAGPQASVGLTSVDLVARIRGQIGFRAPVQVVVHNWGSSASTTGTDGVVSVPPYPFNLYPYFAPRSLIDAWSPQDDRALLVAGGVSAFLIPVRADETYADEIKITFGEGEAWQFRAAWSESRLFLAGVRRNCDVECLVIRCFTIEGTEDSSWGEGGVVRLEGSGETAVEAISTTNRGLSLLTGDDGLFSARTLGASGALEHVVSGLSEADSSRRAYLRTNNGLIVTSFDADLQTASWMSRIRLYGPDMTPIRLSSGEASVEIPDVSIFYAADAPTGGFYTCGMDRSSGFRTPIVQRWRDDGTPDSTFGRFLDGTAQLFRDAEHRAGYCEKLVVSGDRLVALVKNLDSGYSLVALQLDGELDKTVGSSGEIMFPSASGWPALSLGLRGEAVFAYSSGSYGIRVHKLY